ncbi:IPTL-CTERM sorting domain-containing protein [Candidatus Kapabacteria bacterium]|nr:IPTL-CTERM sorting domain-containing protein [Candidatus Kapabacteria bacterium]
MKKIFLFVIFLSGVAFGQSSGSWTQLETPTEPSARRIGMMARISETEALLFGGIDGGGNNNETWRFDRSSGSWTQLSTPTQPSARYGSMMSRISENDVLLFGGDNGTYNNETWRFNNNSGSWTQLATPTQPSARRYAMMSRISDSEVLLFGGFDDSRFNDTWLFDNNSGSWTQLATPSQPSVRNQGMMSRISDTEVLLFGGHDGNNIDETWLFDRSSGSWTELITPSQPSARRDAMMARISNNEALLFGGRTSVDNNDTWLFERTSGSWSQLATPSQPSIRRLAMMDRISDTEILLFGGSDGVNFDETWIFDTEPPMKPVIYNLTGVGLNNSTSATISMDLYSGNVTTTYTFDIGLSSGNYIDSESATISGSSSTVNVGINPTTLTAATQYFIRASATNSVSWTESNETSFWTLDAEPSVHSNTFYQIGQNKNEIVLGFAAFGANADGYLIIQTSSNVSSSNYPVDGSDYSVTDNIGNGTVVAKITNNTATSFTVSSLVAQQDYNFVLIPYKVGSNIATTNYLTANPPTLRAFTIPTLGDWGMYAFMGLMLIGGVWYVRRS